MTEMVACALACVCAAQSAELGYGLFCHFNHVSGGEKEAEMDTSATF